MKDLMKDLMKDGELKKIIELVIKEIIEKEIMEEEIIEKEIMEEETVEDARAKLDIPLEVSARHIHLSESDINILFGEHYKLTAKRALSQPGEFLAEERLKVVNDKGEFSDVAVLGPARSKTQVELSATDCKILGIAAPVTLSGKLNEAKDINLVSQKGMICAKGSVIIAKSHIHMTENDAKKYEVTDGHLLNVRLITQRPIVLENVVVRVNDSFSLAMHIDLDEANAALVQKNTAIEFVP